VASTQAPATSAPTSDVPSGASAGAAASVSSLDYRLSTRDDNPGGRATFHTYGDIMRVCDVQADGWAARLRVWDLEGYTYRYTLRASGNGTCDTGRASYGGPYDLKEGHTYQVVVDLVKGSRADFGEVGAWWNHN
jgi:hypothetical protein